MIRNDGNTSLAMTAMLSGCLFNIVFDYIFVFPMGLGLFGAVLATAVALIISILILLQHFMKKKNQFRLIRVRPDVRLVASAAGLGVPSLVTEVSSGLVIAVFNLLILGLAGNVGVAAYGVVANIHCRNCYLYQYRTRGDSRFDVNTGAARKRMCIDSLVGQ